MISKKVKTTQLYKVTSVISTSAWEKGDSFNLRGLIVSLSSFGKWDGPWYRGDIHIKGYVKDYPHKEDWSLGEIVCVDGIRLLKTTPEKLTI